MEAGFPIDTALPLVIAAMMLGVGMSLRVADFTALARAPGAAVIGLLNMYVAFPAIAFALAATLPLTPELRIGLVLLAASPSASTSTLFTHLARGDAALSLALTSVSKFLPVFVIPVYVGLASLWFAGSGTDIEISFAQTSGRLGLMVLAPVVAGMALRHALPAIAGRLRPAVTGAAVIALIVLIAALVWRERDALPAMFLAAGPAAFALCLLGMAWGYGSSTLLRLGSARRTAITLELGMQSGGTAIAIAAGVLASPAMAVPAAVYSLIMYVAAGIFVAWQRGIARPPAATVTTSGSPP